MGSEEKNFEITEAAVREIIYKLLSDIDYIQVHSSKDIEVEKVDASFAVSINLVMKQLKPIPESGQFVQQFIYDNFKSSTGIELKQIDLFVENIIGD